jgi:hypothetical protein
MADDTPRKDRVPAGSAIKDIYNRGTEFARQQMQQVQKRLNTRQPTRKGGVR